jgi:hypothetical protein
VFKAYEPTPSKFMLKSVLFITPLSLKAYCSVFETKVYCRVKKIEISNLLELHYSDLCTGGFAQDIADNSFFVRFEKGEIMLKYNDEVDYVPLILEGEAEIKTSTSSAKEIIAYTVKPGVYCSLVLLNCLTGTPSLVKAECTKDVAAVMVPKSVALNWLSSNPNWRKHLMEDVSIKYNTLLSQLK